MDKIIENAKIHFGNLVKEQLERVERMKKAGDWVDYTTIKPIIIGFVGGLLKEEIENGNIEFRVIEGLTIENRAKVMKAIPDDVLVEIKKCHVLLKGPTTTPRKGDKWPNIESANHAS